MRQRTVVLKFLVKYLTPHNCTSFIVAKQAARSEVNMIWKVIWKIDDMQLFPNIGY
jgi:hypothetical protein